MAGRKRGTRNADPETIQNALDAWIRLGSSKAAAVEAEVSDSTLRTWKERHPELWDRLRHRHAQELQERHGANVRRALDDLNDAALLAARRLRETGDQLEGRDFRPLFQCIADFAFRGDTISRLDDGKPTSIAGTESLEDILAERAERRQRLVAMGVDPDDPSVSHTLEERH